MPKFFAGNRSLLVAGVLVLGATLTACKDATSPVAAEPQMSGYLTTSAAVRSDRDVIYKKLYPKTPQQTPTKSMSRDTTVEKFWYDPQRGVIANFGRKNGDAIALPAGSVCDPVTTAYGPTEWLKPCTPATARIDFEIKSWVDASGRPHARFSPDVRFDPNSEKPVTLYFQDNLLTDFSVVEIPYCNASNVCVNEGLTDAALKTYAAPAKHGGYWVFRALRHFSGYNVTAF